MKMRVIATALSLLLGCAPAAADVLFRDYFSYPDGPLGSQGDWFDTSQVTVADGVAAHSGAGDGPGLVFNAKHEVPEQGALGTEAWIVIRAHQLVDDAVLQCFGGLGLYDGTIERLLIGKAWDEADEWAVIAPSGGNQELTGVDASTPEPVVVVVRITYGLFLDTAEIWADPINPQFLGDPDASIGGSFEFNRVLLRSGNGGDCRFAFDMVALGDDFDGLLDPEPTPDCPGDINETGEITFSDLLAVLEAWGDCPGCAADVDGDGVVGFNDLLAVLGGWGPCPE